MIELKSRIRLVLMADTTLATMLNVVPGTTRKAVYINHLSQFTHVMYPAISIFMEGGGVDSDVVFAEDYPVQLDVWTEDRQDAPQLAYGLTGAWQIYRRMKQLLHQSQLNGIVADTAYAVMRFAEIPGSVSEDYEPDQKLHHIMTRFRARLIPTDAELITPN